jgi:hypothetical protein
MLPTKFQFIWESGFRREYLLEIKQTWPPQAIIVSDWLISKISSLLKKDNSCLNIDICIQNAVISIQIKKNLLL